MPRTLAELRELYRNDGNNNAFTQVLDQMIATTDPEVRAVLVKGSRVLCGSNKANYHWPGVINMLLGLHLEMSSLNFQQLEVSVSALFNITTLELARVASLFRTSEATKYGQQTAQELLKFYGFNPQEVRLHDRIPTGERDLAQIHEFLRTFSKLDSTIQDRKVLFNAYCNTGHFLIIQNNLLLEAIPVLASRIGCPPLRWAGWQTLNSHDLENGTVITDARLHHAIIQSDINVMRAKCSQRFPGIGKHAFKRGQFGQETTLLGLLAYFEGERDRI